MQPAHVAKTKAKFVECISNVPFKSMCTSIKACRVIEEPCVKLRRMFVSPKPQLMKID